MRIHSPSRFLSLTLLIGLLASLSHPALAENDKDLVAMRKTLSNQESLIKKQQNLLTEQRSRLALQEKEITDHRAKLEEIFKRIDAGLGPNQGAEKLAALSPLESEPSSHLLSDPEMKTLAGAGKPTAEVSSSDSKDLKKEAKASKIAANREKAAAPQGTSIVAPSKEEKRPEIAVLPDAGGVLTPKGVLMYENALEYVNTTNNVFTFNGVQVAEVVFIGVTNATTAKRQVVQDSNRFRLGLTNQLEADFRVPYVYRSDTTSETNTSSNITTRSRIEGNGLGDIDGGLAYQVNKGKEGWPFLVTNLRYKANNAKGPFDVPYDANSMATQLPTGTGFHAVEGSLTAIKVSDPAVLFSNLGYVHNFDRTIDKTFGNTRVLDVSPGSAINASAGLGFSINPETSLTLGYKHSYVFPTLQLNQKISDGTFSRSESDSASVGALMAGASYRFSPSTSMNFNVEIGATREAPDVRVGLRVPVRLGSLF